MKFARRNGTTAIVLERHTEIQTNEVNAEEEKTVGTLTQQVLPRQHEAVGRKSEFIDKSLSDFIYFSVFGSVGTSYMCENVSQWNRK